MDLEGKSTTSPSNPQFQTQLQSHQLKPKQLLPKNETVESTPPETALPLPQLSSLELYQIAIPHIIQSNSRVEQLISKEKAKQKVF